MLFISLILAVTLGLGACLRPSQARSAGAPQPAHQPFQGLLVSLR